MASYVCWGWLVLIAVVGTLVVLLYELLQIPAVNGGLLATIVLVAGTVVITFMVLNKARPAVAATSNSRPVGTNRGLVQPPTGEGVTPTDTTSQPKRDPIPSRRWISFGAVLLVISGAFSLIAGIAAITEARVYTGNVVLISQDLRTWGLTWLFYGLLEVLAGVGILLTRRTWAQVFGVVLVGLNAIGHLIFIPAYPFWSILIIVLDIVVIYALIVHGEEYTQPRS